MNDLEVGAFGEMSFVKRVKRKYQIAGQDSFMDWGFVMTGEIVEMDDKYILFRGMDETESDRHLVNKKRIRYFERKR